MTAEFWEYDARLGRRWNVDPKPMASISVYVCFVNNPIWFNDIKGDSSVINSAGTVLYADKNDMRVFMKEKDKMSLIGEIGKELDLSKVIDNRLKYNRGKAKSMDILDFYDVEKAGGIWDFKNNTNTIFGLAWETDINEQDESKHTKLKWGNYKFKDASAFGNFHFGYVGSYTYGGNGMSPATLVYAAGAAEIKKSMLDDRQLFDAMDKFNSFLNRMPPYGDQMNDFIDILSGIGHAQKEKGK
jgi:hypothetical protein